MADMYNAIARLVSDFPRTVVFFAFVHGTVYRAGRSVGAENPLARTRCCGVPTSMFLCAISVTCLLPLVTSRMLTTVVEAVLCRNTQLWAVRRKARVRCFTKRLGVLGFLVTLRAAMVLAVTLHVPISEAGGSWPRAGERAACMQRATKTSCISLSFVAFV